MVAHTSAVVVNNGFSHFIRCFEQEFFVWLREHCYRFPQLTDMYDSRDGSNKYRCRAETVFCNFLQGQMATAVVEALRQHDEDVINVRNITPSTVTLMTVCEHPIFQQTQDSAWDSGRLAHCHKATATVKPEPLPADIPVHTHIQFRNKPNGPWKDGVVVARHTKTMCQVTTSSGDRLDVDSRHLYRKFLTYWPALRPRVGEHLSYQKKQQVRVVKCWPVPTNTYEVAPLRSAYFSQYGWMNVHVNHANMRGVLTEEQRREQRVLAAELRKAETCRKLKMECPLQRSVHFHETRAWRKVYGQNNTLHTVARRFWKKLGKGVLLHLEAVRSLDLQTTTSWGKVSKLLLVDEHVRLLRKTVDDIPQASALPKKTLAEYCDVEMQPEYLLDRICSLLDNCHADLQNLSFSNEPKLATANESDKIDFFRPVLDKYQRVHDAVTAVGDFLPERFAAKKVECRVVVIAAVTTLASMFNKANFPPLTDNQFDGVNSIIATLEVFTQVCGPSLRDDASRIFNDLKVAIQQRFVSSCRFPQQVSCVSLSEFTAFDRLGEIAQEAKAHFIAQVADDNTRMIAISTFVSTLLKIVYVEMRVSTVAVEARNCCQGLITWVSKEMDGDAHIRAISLQIPKMSHAMVPHLLAYDGIESIVTFPHPSR